MAEESENKMEALKKAYAEIILNTSKDAAVRVMMADRKARCYEQQLLNLKQDSLSMMLRLKDHFNFLTIETEARSLKQEMKIEELEAQLCEAEGIIVDLRGELNQVREKLEITRRNQKTVNEHISVMDNVVRECMPQRIRAFEGNSSNVRSPTSQSENKKFLLNVQPTTNAEETMKHRQHSTDNVDFSMDSLCSSKPDMKTAKNTLLGELHHHSSSFKGQVVRSRRSARKNTRYREAINSLQGTCKTRLRCLRNPLKRCYSRKAVEIPIEIVEMDPKKIKSFHVTETDDLSCNSDQVVCTAERNDSQTREPSSYKSYFADDGLQDSVLVDVPISEGFGSSRISSGDRLMKFTFQRKRRKNVLDKIDENSPRDRFPAKKILGNSPNIAVGENC
ncbi:uncharacterized protein LOC130801948 isoform X2 [Amaranthus tricolor]|uniref:uncharacterized protein LOC130801948 isoform X2 n=1 Tax=Amaranthus tricolor TaxID=29722 RepID=UPI002588DE54|nr:uncharacterized protein LOC130801948 isoform X2 [Amaranthus tricolor]